MIAFFSLLGAALRAADVRVSASGGENALAKAIEQAATGDRVLLSPGVYRGGVTIEKAITLEAEAGAIISGDTPIKEEWKPAGNDFTGVFTTPCEHRPSGLLWKGKFVAALDFKRAGKEGEWHWATLLKKGAPLSGFSQIIAMYVYHPKEKRIYFRSPKGQMPAKGEVTLVANDQPLVTVGKVAGVTLKRLQLRNGAVAISMLGATDCKVEGCEIISYEDCGIAIMDESSKCVVENCKITRGALEEWAPSLKHDRANYEIWRVHKDVGYYDRVGINIFRAGSGNRILNNQLDRVFDGICIGDYSCETLDKPLRNPDHGRDTEIAGNTISNTRDSGIELGVGCINVQVHHNTLTRTHGGFRFKTPRIGPVFIHHNQLLGGAPFGFWFSMDCSPAEGYIYHNTITGDGPALTYLIHKPTQEEATPNWKVFNNLVATRDGFFEEESKKKLGADFEAGNNVVAGDARPWPEGGDNKRDGGSVYGMKTPEGWNVTKMALPEAIDAGRNLTKAWNGKPLPGCQSGSFKGKAPDAGAVEWR